MRACTRRTAASAPARRAAGRGGGPARPELDGADRAPLGQRLVVDRRSRVGTRTLIAGPRRRRTARARRRGSRAASRPASTARAMPGSMGDAWCAPARRRRGDVAGPRARGASRTSATSVGCEGELGQAAKGEVARPGDQHAAVGLAGDGPGRRVGPGAGVDDDLPWAVRARRAAEDPGAAGRVERAVAPGRRGEVVGPIGATRRSSASAGHRRPGRAPVGHARRPAVATPSAAGRSPSRSTSTVPGRWTRTRAWAAASTVAPAPPLAAQ